MPVVVPLLVLVLVFMPVLMLVLVLAVVPRMLPSPPLCRPPPLVLPQGRGGGPSLGEPQKGQATAQGCCPKHSCGKW